MRGRIPITIAVALGLLVPAGAAQAATSGGAAFTSPSGTTKAPKARLVNGIALAPASAPLKVKKMIWAANRIHGLPYKYGGGHARWKDDGYDCSGAISYLHRAAGLLRSPIVAPAFNEIGEPGPGKWVTVYAHGGHVYAIIAGLRFDTSPFGDGEEGPGWRRTPRPSAGFTATHPRGL